MKSKISIDQGNCSVVAIRIKITAAPLKHEGCRMVNARLCETARLISFLRARALFSLAK